MHLALNAIIMEGDLVLLTLNAAYIIIWGFSGKH